MTMKHLRRFSQTPCGQVLLATLLFCFIFLALFVGLYKAGSVYIAKEQARRSTNLTALSAGSVYANGLQLVRDSNVLLMVLVVIDLKWDGAAAAAAIEGGPPAMMAAAYAADKVNRRTPFQKFQDVFFGVDGPGAYPWLIEGQATATGSENRLSFLPAYAYNYETATISNVTLPNMALRFRTAADLLPEPQKGLYSLLHEGERHYFSSDEVEPANNPRHPSQMRVKKGSNSPFAAWWVKKEKSGGEKGDTGGVLTKYVPEDLLNSLRKFLSDFKFDVTDRDDPPCHTFTLLSVRSGNVGKEEKNFYQTGEVRVETWGLAAWDVYNPYSIYLDKVDIAAFPAVRNMLQKIGSTPMSNQILASSDILNGL